MGSAASKDNHQQSPYARFVGGFNDTSIDSDGQRATVRHQQDESKNIAIESLHLSCHSDVGVGKGWEQKNLGGIMILSTGSLESKTVYKTNISPGYIFMKNTDIDPVTGQIKNKEKGDQGGVHGMLCRLLLGCQPSDVINAGGCISGFGIVNGQLKFNSGSMNTYGDYVKQPCINHEMSRDEQTMIQAAIEGWKDGSFRNNIPISAIHERGVKME